MVHSDTDGDFGMFGIYAKNRAEWIISDIAGILTGFASVTLYDTLGMEFIDFILNQTELRTLFLSGDKVENILELKKSGKLGFLKWLVVYDSVSEELVGRGREQGL